MKLKPDTYYLLKDGRIMYMPAEAALHTKDPLGLVDYYNCIVYSKSRKRQASFAENGTYVGVINHPPSHPATVVEELDRSQILFEKGIPSGLKAPPQPAPEPATEPASNGLTPEVGKKYLTRDNRIAHIKYCDPSDTHPFKGTIAGVNETVFTWTSNGNYFSSGPGNGKDLVALYEPTTLQIKAGHRYMTRGGEIATVTYVDTTSAYQINGFIDSPARIITWSKDGYYFAHSPGDDRDIVYEIDEQDPPQKPQPSTPEPQTMPEPVTAKKADILQAAAIIFANAPSHVEDPIDWAVDIAIALSSTIDKKIKE